jgi:hypothetical protein
MFTHYIPFDGHNVTLSKTNHFLSFELFRMVFGFLSSHFTLVTFVGESCATVFFTVL